MILSIRNLKKSFGSQVVFDHLSLDIEPGSIFGFLGQNGAGKTTTMKLILGLIAPDEGQILVDGEPVQFGYTKTNRHIGYLPDVPEFYPYLNAKEYLSLCADILGLTPEEKKKRIHELLELVGLHSIKKRIGGYSRGMKQRLGIAQALIGEPKLLICDEPTSALDPIGRKEILDILLKIKHKTTVLFSTHILSDVERICDYVVVLHQGKLVINTSMNDLRKHTRQDAISIHFQNEEEMQKFLALPVVASLKPSVNEEILTLTIHTTSIKETQSLLYEQVHTHHIYPTKIEVNEPTLESLFLEVVK